MAEAKKKEKAKVVKETKKEEKVTKKVKKDVKKKDKKEKKSLWTRFRIFCHGVKSETLSVHWPNKKDMIKYYETKLKEQENYNNAKLEEHKMNLESSIKPRTISDTICDFADSFARSAEALKN